MKEFLLLIRTPGNPWETMSPKEAEEHVKKGNAYIGQLIQSGKLKSGQPLDFQGTIISSAKGALKDGPFNETKEVIAGYLILLAKDLAEAIDVAKQNPIFEDIPGVRIEVRPM